MAWTEPVNLEWVYEQPWSMRAREVYFWLLHCRSRKEHDFTRSGRTITIKAGEFATNRREIAERLKLTQLQVRRAVDELILTGAIETTQYRNFTVFCVKNARKAAPEAVTNTLTNPKQPQLFVIQGELAVKKESVTNTLPKHKKNTVKKNTVTANTELAKPLSTHVKEVFQQRYRDKYGCNYPWSVREAVHAKRLSEFLESSAGEFFELLDKTTSAFLADNEKWLLDNRHPLGSLASKPNRWFPQKQESQFPGLVSRSL